jgi:hypothetical protein
MELVSISSETPIEMETAKSLPKEIIVQIIEDYFAFRNTELKNLCSAIEEQGPNPLSLTDRKSPQAMQNSSQLNQSYDRVSISHHRGSLACRPTTADLPIRL